MVLAESCRKNVGLALLVSMAMLVNSGCSHTAIKAQAAPENETADTDSDSLESYNRIMYQFNYTVDGIVLKPVTVAYRYVVPEKGRQAVSNVIDNLYTPVVFINSVLQVDPQNSFATLWRFIINTTIGLGGINDVASAAGLKSRPADFGETLAMWGVNSGPYFVLPIIGPSTVRDASGRIIDAFINPFNYMGDTASAVLWTSTAIDARSRNSKLIDDIYCNSLDPYATFRSGYMQKRAADIRRAEASQQKALDQTGVR